MDDLWGSSQHDGVHRDGSHCDMRDLRSSVFVLACQADSLQVYGPASTSDKGTFVGDVDTVEYIALPLLSDVAITDRQGEQGSIVGSRL